MPTPLDTRFTVAALLCFAFLAGGGCSISESVSASISSPFTSSSASSKSNETRYNEEVADYSEAFAKAGGGDVTSFKRGLGEIATKRGISDWEANPGTWSSIGFGLGRAGITEAAFMGYQTSWSGGDSARADLMKQGFDKAR